MKRLYLHLLLISTIKYIYYIIRVYPQNITYDRTIASCYIYINYLYFSQTYYISTSYIKSKTPQNTLLSLTKPKTRDS